MLVSALISMWVMNTSTTLMLLPIGLAICSVVAKTVPNMSEKDKSNFDKALYFLSHMQLPSEGCQH